LVVDFGAGDGRFSENGKYKNYVGYEIDVARCRQSALPENAVLINQCAFEQQICQADICIGNPPYVRNQDLPSGWRQLASIELERRSGVKLSGLANAWQYFFLLSLLSTKETGLVALVIPYEWVSRPSARALREFILGHGWDVSVFRLSDDTFHRVLTTSSITIIDKKKKTGGWRYFEQNDAGKYIELLSPSGCAGGVLGYAPRTIVNASVVRAKRGLSPGTQEVLTLTEGERVRHGLKVNVDVVPCVTSLKNCPEEKEVLTENLFKEMYRDFGSKCWLIRTDKEPSSRLAQYLEGVDSRSYQTATCLFRECWWKFSMPSPPSLLVATGFRGARPKVLVNEIGARAVGGVCGVYGLDDGAVKALASRLRDVDFSGKIVAHSNGLKKLEINQLNTVLAQICSPKGHQKC
jgi:hypothetical protein